MRSAAAFTTLLLLMVSCLCGVVRSAWPHSNKPQTTRTPGNQPKAIQTPVNNQQQVTQKTPITPVTPKTPATPKTQNKISPATQQPGQSTAAPTGVKYLLLLHKEDLAVPIPFKDGHPPSIIYPNKEYQLEFEKDEVFKLTCPTSKFKNINTTKGINEVQVRCVGHNKFIYGNISQEFKYFECSTIPLSTLVEKTDKKCRIQSHTLFEVGFDTGNNFLKLYKGCFDKLTKNSVYTWYRAQSTFWKNTQSYKTKPFKKTLYGNTEDPDSYYELNTQKTNLAKILGGTELADMYIKSNDQCLSRGHYLPKADFYYSFEKRATYYYANVAPQWQPCNAEEWSDLEELTRKPVAGEKGDYLIVTGSRGSCMLPDKNNVKKPLFLKPGDGNAPSLMPVPLFFWKLVYKGNTTNNYVYVGINGPCQEDGNDRLRDKLKSHCTIMENEKRSDENKVIHKCEKELLETILDDKLIDPIVYDE